MENNKLSPSQMIKQFCRVCNGETDGGHYYDCLDKNCPLYPMKEGKGNYETGTEHLVSDNHKKHLSSLGKNLVRKSRVGRVLTEEHKAKMKAGRLAKKALQGD